MGWFRERRATPVVRKHRSDSEIEVSISDFTQKPPPPESPPPMELAEESYVNDRDSRAGRSTISSFVEDSAMRRSSTRRYSYLEAGARVMDKSTVFVSRCLISGLAVALLWGTSLTAITNLLKVSNAIAMPEVQLVVSEAISLFNQTVKLRGEYISCVTEELDVCNASLVIRMQEELTRSQEARNKNFETRRESQTTAGKCATAHARSMAAVTAWINQQGVGSNQTKKGQHYNAACSAEDQEHLEQQTGDSTAQKGATYQLAKGYSSSSKTKVNVLAQQLAARAAYDEEYIKNKTIGDTQLGVDIGNIGLNASLMIDARFEGMSLDEIRACATLAGGACPNGDSALALAAAAQAELLRKADLAGDTYTATATSFQNYADQTASRLQQLQNDLATIRSTINTNINVGCTAPCFDTMFPAVDLSTNRFTLSPGTIDLTIPPITVPQSDSFAAIAGQTSAAVDALEAKIAEARANANLDTTHLRAKLGDLDVNALEDYNPPRVDGKTDEQLAAETRDEHARESAQFEQDTAVSLDAIDQAEAAGRNGTGYSPIFASNISASRLIKDAQNTNWFSYKLLDDAGFAFEWILGPLDAISSLFQSFDAIYRSFRTLQILRKFWGRSALAIAPIDVTTDADSSSRTRKVVSTPLRTVAMILTHPLALTGVFLGFSFLIGGIALTFYMPIFQAYQTDCRGRDEDGRPTGDGTVLTRNAYAVAFNYASHTGNKMRLSGLDDYEITRSDNCARHGEKSAQDEQRVQKDMDLIVGSHVRTQANVALMKRCYNITYLDEQFRDNPPRDVNGEAFPLLSTTLAEEACQVGLTNATLEDGIYKCTELPDCHIECNDLADEHGNDQSDLYPYSRTAMCTAQWYFHSTILRIAFTTAIWVFLNLWRVLFVGGVTRVIWQFLNSGYFSYLATCSVDGEHTYTVQDLADKVRALLSKQRLYGAFLVLVACATQVPWISGMYYFSKGLVYEKLT